MGSGTLDLGKVYLLGMELVKLCNLKNICTKYFENKLGWISRIFKRFSRDRRNLIEGIKEKISIKKSRRKE